MTFITSHWFMIRLDLLMISHTLWVLLLSNKNRFHFGLGVVLLTWLVLLHFGLSSKSIFPETISGVLFLTIIFTAVAAVGIVLFAIPTTQKILLGLTQQQLLLLQGIRVFYGARFLMYASVGALPLVFGIVDGWTHIAAGFLALMAAYSFSTNSHAIRRAWFANIFGLAEILLVASTLALFILQDVTPDGLVMYAAFLPAPLLLWFHFISIYRLITDKDEPSVVSPE